MRKGYTLFEVILVLGITVIVGVAALLNLPMLFRSTELLNSITSELVARLNDARDRAISQVESAKWGIHLDAATSGGHFYKIFYGDSYAAGTVTQIISIPPSIVFLSPAQGNTDDIIFEKVVGMPFQDHGIVLALSDDHSVSRYISISKDTGLISGLDTVPAQDFLLTLSSAAGTVNAGSSINSNITITIISGAPALTTFSASNLPSGVTSNFSSATCIPTCSSVMELITSVSTPGATTAVTVTATSGSLVKSLIFYLTVQSTPPAAPQNLAAVGGLNKIDITWQAPVDNGGPPITNYKIYRGTISGGETLLATIGNALAYSDTDAGLVNNITYYYKVAAVNSSATGSQSNEASGLVALRVFLSNSRYPGALGGLAGADNTCNSLAGSGNWRAWLSTNSVTASSRLAHYNGPYVEMDGTRIANNWSDLTDGVLITGININQFGNVVSDGSDIYKLVWTDTSNNGSAVSANHCSNWTSSSGSVYGIIGQYGYANWWTNASTFGCSANARLYCFENPFEAPSAPQSLMAKHTNNQMQLNWLAPAYIGGTVITNYKIYRGASPGTETLLTTVGNVLTYTDTTAVSGTYYYYKVSAVNVIGEGIQSNEIISPWSGNRVFVTNGNINGGSISSAYAADSYCQSSANAVSLGGAWLAWISDTVNSPSSRFTQTGSPYYFANGSGFLANNWADLTDGVLSNPLGITETGGVRNASYVWTSTLESGTASNYKCSEGPYGSIGYSGNVNYAWSHVVFGYGDYSSCGGNFPLYCFEQPLHVSYTKNLILSASDSQVVLNWAAPDYNGGSAITNYKIYRGIASNGETLLTTIGNVLTYTDATAVNGTVYYYKVSAVNSAAKEGDRSLGASAIPGFLPSVAQNPIATAAGIQINLQWQAPASQGSGPVTNYKIYRATSSGAETLLTTVGNVLVYSDTNLPTGTRYYYKIAAVNVVGTGTLSSEVTALTHTWQDVAGTGNYNESCGAWLTRTGQIGLGSPYTRVMDSADGVNYFPSYTGRCTYHADPFASIGSISPYTTADPTMYPISGGTGFGLYSKTQSLR